MKGIRIMQFKIDQKSMLVGIAAGMLAMLVLGASDSANPVGRYQVAVGTSYAVVVDTATGQAWGANVVSLSGIQAGFFEKKTDR
jgi:hypothetical protein